MSVRVTVRLESGLFQQAAFRRSLVQIVTRFAFAVESTMKISIQQGSKTGRIYRRGAIKKVVGARTANSLGLRKAETAKGRQKFVVGFGFHRASAPGQAPASDSTHLVNSIKAERATSDARGIHALITVNAKYAAILEHGGGYMAARPFVAPAAKKNEPKFQAAVAGLVARAVA